MAKINVKHSLFSVFFFIIWRSLWTFKLTQKRKDNKTYIVALLIVQSKHHCCPDWHWKLHVPLFATIFLSITELSVMPFLAVIPCPYVMLNSFHLERAPSTKLSHELSYLKKKLYRKIVVTTPIKHEYLSRWWSRVLQSSRAKDENNPANGRIACLLRRR